MHHSSLRLLLVNSAKAFLVPLCFSSVVFAQSAAILEGDSAIPLQNSQGMVVTSHTLASTVAREVLAEGGNAIDAAVTAGFALAVTQPRSGNIGGGGFMLISRSTPDEVVAIDYRETAPAKAHRDMFLDESGAVDSQRSRFSHLSVGVPGTVAGLLMALDKYGTIRRERALAPAIKLAEEGFIVPPRFTKGLESVKDRLQKSPASRSTFYKFDGSAYQPGERFIQPELAATLKRISEQGRDGFYLGETARLLAEEMAANDGIMTEEDISNYQPKIRKPVQGNYRGYNIYSMPPPSSGGIHIVQILNILEGYPIGSFGHNSAKTIHLMAEAMKRAYADRATYLGDSDFVKVPVTGLISKEYAAELRKSINTTRATPSQEISAGLPSAYESNETTHFSVADKYGNVVANTYTINFSYGSGITVKGAGFLLNNQMDDFSAKPGTANAYGLTGAEANSIAGNKRMLSSMSPSIVKYQGKNLLVTGSPGGSRIITTTLQVIMNVIDHGLNIQEAVNAPRIHHQWLPDSIRIEQGISPDTQQLLESMGHKIELKSAMGASQSIYIDPMGGFQGAADPRRSTSSAQGL